MYSKIALLLLSVVLASTQNDCNCSDATLEQSLKESRDFVELYLKLSNNGVTDEEKYPLVPPGLVTGPLGCQCSENLRRKRKIMPKEDIPLIDKPQTSNDEEAPPPSKRFSSRNCPVGYLRVGRTCMLESDIY